jgi:hypothetical protein
MTREQAKKPRKKFTRMNLSIEVNVPPEGFDPQIEALRRVVQRETPQGMDDHLIIDVLYILKGLQKSAEDMV